MAAIAAGLLEGASAIAAFGATAAEIQETITGIATQAAAVIGAVNAGVDLVKNAQEIYKDAEDGTLNQNYDPVTLRALGHTTGNNNQLPVIPTPGSQPPIPPDTNPVLDEDGCYMVCMNDPNGQRRNQVVGGTGTPAAPTVPINTGTGTTMTCNCGGCGCKQQNVPTGYDYVTKKGKCKAWTCQEKLDYKNKMCTQCAGCQGWNNRYRKRRTYGGYRKRSYSSRKKRGVTYKLVRA